MSDRLGLATWAHISPPKHRDFGDSPDEVHASVEKLANAGFDLIIPRVKGNETGYADFFSGVIDVNAAYPKWDPLRVLIEAADQHGMKVHPYVNVFPEGPHSALLRRAPDVVAKDDWLEARYAGRTRWTCACRPEVQEYELALLADLAERYPVHGLQLDMVRTGGRCRCAYCTEQMAARGVDVNAIDLASRADDPPAWAGLKADGFAPWMEWRCERVTAFVRQVREMTLSKGVELSAAVFHDVPSCSYTNGQDWTSWAEEGLVDLLCPMNYDNSTRTWRLRTRQHAALVAGKCLLWEGIGKMSSLSTLSTAALMEQVEAAAQEGADGVTIFRYAGLTDEDLAALRRI